MRVAALIKGILTAESDDEAFEPPVQRKTPGRPGSVPLPSPEVAKSKALHLPKAMKKGGSEVQESRLYKSYTCQVRFLQYFFMCC